MTFKPGDRVVYSGKAEPRLSPEKNGRKGTVLENRHSGYTFVRFDSFVVGSREVNCLTGNLKLIKDATVDDLREVVDSLRDQGYAVQVKVTEPPVEPKEIVL